MQSLNFRYSYASMLLNLLILFVFCGGKMRLHVSVLMPIWVHEKILSGNECINLPVCAVRC